MLFLLAEVLQVAGHDPSPAQCGHLHALLVLVEVLLQVTAVALLWIHAYLLVVADQG